MSIDILMFAICSVFSVQRMSSKPNATTIARGIDLLACIVHGIQAKTPTVFKHRKNASVCAILRLNGTTPSATTLSSSAASTCFPSLSDSVRSKLRYSEDTLANGRLELLFLKRVIKSRDPWSGHVAFPGNHPFVCSVIHSCGVLCCRRASGP